MRWTTESLQAPAVTVGLGTTLKTTAGVAGVALAVMIVPLIVGGLFPVVNEISPTSIGDWALLVATHKPASALTPLAWVVSMIILVVGAKAAFDREEH